MQPKIIEKYFFFGLLLATLIFTFLIFRPFWVVLILGVSFAIVLYPMHEWFIHRKVPDWLSALLTVCFFVIVLCGPLLTIGAIVFRQSEGFYSKVVNEGSAAPFLTSVESRINGFLPDMVAFDINQKTSDFVSYASKNIANIFTSTLSAFFSFLLMLLIIFYFLKNGSKLKHNIIVLSPLAQDKDEKLILRLTQAVNGVIKQSLFIAVIQGILMGVGLWFFNVPNPALWGVVAAIASLIPTFGTALVSIPAIIYLFATGDTGAAVGLIVWSTIVVGMIDNFLSPVIMGKEINIPSILILFAVLGGISFLGPVGILVGPLTLSLLFALISIYKNEFN